MATPETPHEPPSPGAHRYWIERDAILHGHPFGARPDSDHAAGEMECGHIPHPRVFNIVERDEIPVVILVGVVFLADVGRAVDITIIR